MIIPMYVVDLSWSATGMKIPFDGQRCVASQLRSFGRALAL